MASVLETRKVHRRDVNRFVLTQAYRLKDHARQMAAREGRPYQYFGERTRKEDLARQLAERDGIEEGLVCVVATVEPCRTCSLRWREGAAFIQSARRKCLILYDSFMDREFGLIHVCSCRSPSTGTSGWRGSSRTTACGTPSTTMRFCGSRTSRGPSALPIGLSACRGWRGWIAMRVR